MTHQENLLTVYDEENPEVAVPIFAEVKIRGIERVHDLHYVFLRGPKLITLKMKASSEGGQ